MNTIKVVTVAALLAASTAQAGRFTFTYNFYWKNDRGPDNYITQRDSTVPPGRLNQGLTNPDLVAVPQNASSQYPSWNELWGTASRIPKPPAGCKRGGPNPKAPVCR